MARLKDLLDEAEEGVEYSEVVFDTITDLGSNPFVSEDLHLHAP